MEVSDQVRVKNEPIFDSQSIKHERKSIQINDSKRTRESISSDDNPNSEQPNKRKRQSIVAMGIKEEPIDSEIQTSKSQIEVKVEKEEKFSATEEFANKASIAFLNEEETTTNNPKSSSQNSK